MYYTIITLNGKSATFEADEVNQDGERYIFSLDGEVVAQFLIKGIAGYFGSFVESNDEECY